MNRKVLLVGLLLVVPLLGLLLANLGRDPRRVDSPMIGKPAPPFSLKPVAGGETVSLDALRGKTVVLNFWATWCAPCFEEHGELQRAARSLGPEVRFFGVVYEDEEERVRTFLKQQGSAYPSLLDDGGKIAIAYGVYGVPETYFISPQGVITSKYAQPLDEATIRRAVREAQAGTAGGAS
ncbi:MAG TPA: redoxin domain-containing protein [Vicinamibacteria bacterium]|nr:redoxin domain-containing protein [Vicinamibacteria bacterium]